MIQLQPHTIQVTDLHGSSETFVQNEERKRLRELAEQYKKHKLTCAKNRAKRKRK